MEVTQPAEQPCLPVTSEGVVTSEEAPAQSPSDGPGRESSEPAETEAVLAGTEMVPSTDGRVRLRAGTGGYGLMSISNLFPVPRFSCIDQPS